MNSILVFTYPAGIIIVLLLVFGLGFFLTRRFNLGWRFFWIGAAMFIISQILHIPFNGLLNRLLASGVLPSPPENFHLIYSALLLGLSAGVIEELTRYAGLRWWAKDARSWPRGLLFGSGWGGMEAIIFFVVILSLNYVIFLALLTQDLSSMLSPEQQAQLQVGMDLFWGVEWYDSLLGALERILVIPIQMAFTILVMQVFLRKQSRWLWYAVAFHTLLDAVAVASVRLWGVYATEGILAIITLISLGIIFALRGEEPSEPPEENGDSPQITPQPVQLAPVDENLDNLEGTRYTE
jgi:uncharacterized membrane protein YhfC